MDKNSLLRTTIAEFFEVEEDQVGPAFSLAGRRGHGSLARSALDAAIRRRVGLRSRLVYSAKTFGELEGELFPGPNGKAPAPDTQAVTAVPVPSSPSPSEHSPLSCGIDIEMIDALPVSADPWEDPFYQSHFTPAEIAYCLRQDPSAPHFAARWCAKEALKKCDGSFLSTGMNSIEVITGESGAPSLAHHIAGTVRRLPHSVSLTHTPQIAVAVVVKLEETAGAEPPSPPVVPATTLAAPVLPSSRPIAGMLWFGLGLVTLGVAVLALLRTYGYFR